MPSGKPINWNDHDPLIIENLSNYTITSFTKKFLPHISEKAVGARARKLGIKAGRYKPTDEHKAKISKKIQKYHFTPKIDKFLLNNAPNMAIKELAVAVNIAKSAIWIRLKELGYVHQKEDIEAKHKRRTTEAMTDEVRRKLSESSRGRVFTPAHKEKISEGLKGEKNGQYGKPISEKRKRKMLDTYFNHGGLEKTKKWLNSPAGRAALEKTIKTTKSREFRKRISHIITQKILRGEIRLNVNSKQGYHVSPKAGRVYYRSSYELAYYKMLDRDGDVISYTTEPFSIPYVFEGKEKNYVPDILVVRKQSIELIEVKPQKLVELPVNQSKAEAAEEYCEDKDIDYKIITEKELKDKQG